MAQLRFGVIRALKVSVVIGRDIFDVACPKMEHVRYESGYHPFY